MADAFQTGAFTIPFTGVASTAGGGIVSQANPEGEDLIITRLVCDRQVKSSGAATVDIGVGSSATTSYDNLIDGMAAGATEAIHDNVTDGGTNGKARQIWESDGFLTMSGGATTAGLKGNLYVEYLRRATVPDDPA